MGKCASTPKEYIPPIDLDTEEETSTDVSAVSGSQHSRKNNFSTRSLKDRNYLIQILKATNIPRIPNTSISNSYVVLRIVDIDSNQQKCDNITSLHRITNWKSDPIWNCYRTFEASEFHDKLVFDIYHNDRNIGCGETVISELYINIDNKHIANNSGSQHSQIMIHDDSESDIGCEEDEDCLQDIIINMHTHHETQHKTKQTKLYFKLFAMQSAPVFIERKSIFFIYDTDTDSNCMCRCDTQNQDTLCNTAMEQAIKLNEYWKAHGDNQDIKDFISAQSIYSSPLSRVIQVAMLSLLNHPCLERKGIQCLCNLRDINESECTHKRGDDEIKKAMDDLQSRSHTVNGIQMNLNDCNDWNDIDTDSEKHFDERLTDFMYYIRYSNECLVVCVVHRVWFKGFCKRYIDRKDIEKDRVYKPILDDNETKQDVDDLEQNNGIEDDDNGIGCVRVDIAFSDKYENGLQITDIRKMDSDPDQMCFPINEGNGN